MKILVVAPIPFFVSRGTPIRILEESLALERLGHSVTIASYHIGSEIPSKVSTSIDIRRIRRWIFWYKKTEAGADWQKILLDIMLIRKVFSLARKTKPDVLYGHLHEGALIGWFVQKVFFWRKMLLVGDFHGGLTSEMASHGYLKKSVLFWLFGSLERWINGLGDAAVTSSWENTRNINRHRSKKNPAQTLLDGADTSRNIEISLDERRRIRKKWGIPEEGFVFVYAGALIPNKGIEPMMQGIRLFFKKGRSAHFALAGSPVGYAKELARNLGLEKRISLISPLDYFDLPELLGVCDAGIDPKDSSLHQSSGKILQYMAAGLPVVCLDRKNNRNFLEEGGLYCGEGAEGFARGFSLCIENLQEGRKKGEMNRKRVRKFSWDASARKMEAIIFEAMQKKRF